MLHWSRATAFQIQLNMKHTRQIAGKSPTLIPISMIGIERIDIEKKRFLYKNIFLSPIYFDAIS